IALDAPGFPNTQYRGYLPNTRPCEAWDMLPHNVHQVVNFLPSLHHASADRTSVGAVHIHDTGGVDHHRPFLVKLNTDEDIIRERPDSLLTELLYDFAEPIRSGVI